MDKGPCRRLELHLSYGCDQRCAFCSESLRMARWRRRPPAGREIAKVLLEKRRAGFEHVTFTGGEPTERELLPSALSVARRLGLRTYVTSNGGRFAQAAYAKRVLPLIDELCLSVHGPDAALHDACAGRRGSFARAREALANVERHGAGVYLLTNTVVTRLNWGRLEETLAMLVRRPRVRHCLVSNAAPEGRAARAFAALAVPLEQWRRRVPALLKLFAGRAPALRFFGLPLCALGGREEHSNDAHFSPRVTVERRESGGRPSLAGFASRDAGRGRRRTGRCDGCGAAARCPGAFARYLELFGDAELRPLPAAGPATEAAP